MEGKGWVLAADLQVGDKLQQSNGNTLTIDSIKIVKHDEPVRVYNFTVADFHTYFVSDLGIWVHNIGDDCLPSYSPTVLEKMKKDPTAHNFPTSFDKQILSQKPALVRADGREEYLLTGSMNGKDGVYHMTVRPSDNSIIHRVFIPSSDWARFSKANGLPSLNDIP